MECITDGKFTITAPMQTGLEVNLGRTVVLKTYSVELVICEERWEAYDTGCFTHAGLDPLAARYILLKSRQHFRAGFEPLAKNLILAAGPREYVLRTTASSIFASCPGQYTPLTRK